MYGAKKSPTKKYAGKSPAKKYGSKSPAKKYGAKTPAMKKMTAKQKKAFAGTALGAAIKAAPEPKKKAAPTKKKTPMKMVKSMGNAGMVGKAGTTKKSAIKKTAKKQGYNDRLDESLGMRTGRASTKTQSMKSRRDESKGAKKAAGKRAYSGNRSSAQGKRVTRKR